MRMMTTERVCKWCMITERVAEELDKVKEYEYCAHDGGHEWVDVD
jgi:hypothetical protein